MFIYETIETIKQTIEKDKWDKVFRNGPSEICGRQPLKNLKWYGLIKQMVWKARGMENRKHVFIVNIRKRI